MPNQMLNAGTQFIHDRNAQLHTSGPVELAAEQARAQGERVPNDPTAKLEAYLGRLTDHSLIRQIPDDEPAVSAKLLEKQHRQIEARIIKPEDIPEAYFQTQMRAARELGHGDLEISPEQRRQYAEVLRTDQRESLRDWVDYLTSGDAQYPTWFKYYAIDGVTKLADYDKDKGQFPKRSRGTTDPFPALNREALAYTYDEIDGLLAEKAGLQKALSAQETSKAHKAEHRARLKQINDVFKSARFDKLYAKSLAEIGFADPELLKETRGSWVKYNQSNNPKDISRLSNSLKGYGTGWCTAGEGYARSQLAAGDFYVYYSRDQFGVDRVPRVAVRMQQGQVAEVRGIVGGGANVGPAENTRQEMEPAMIDIAMDKVKGLPGGEAYFQTAADMKRLTAIDNKLANGRQTELTNDEVGFLYELDHQIQSFGYNDDPRVKELQLKAASSRVADILEGLGAAEQYVAQMRNHMRVEALINQVRLEPDKPLSEADIRFVYGLDGEVQTLGTEAHQDLAKSVDYWRGGQDREKIAVLMPEAIREQLQSAYAAYHTVANRLLGSKQGIFSRREIAIKAEQMQHLFERQDREWRTNGIYDHLVEQLIDQGVHFNLVATPNIQVSEAQIVALAENFGQKQPYQTYIYDDLYRQSRYQDDQWSGRSGSTAIRFSLIPDKYDAELGYKSAKRQRQLLADKQANNPKLNLRVPSLLDAVTYWYSLRARGDKLADSSAYDKTYIRHFNLEPQHLGRWLNVPFSCVSVGGGPSLNRSGAEGGDRARLAVG